MVEDVEGDETVREKLIAAFFRGMGVEGLGPGNVVRIIEAGYDTIPLILKMSIINLLSVEGFKEKTATKLYNGIKEQVATASLVTIMSSSNIFGRGFSETKIAIIMEEYPSVLLSKETDKQKIAKIAAIKGMAAKSAEAFVERIPDFIQFMKQTGLNNKLSFEFKEKLVEKEHVLFGKTIVMTGFRDTLLQDKLKEIGAKLGSSVSSKTFAVLVKDTGSGKVTETGKIAEAIKLNIQVMTLCEFNDKYL
jgi:NAD-dependent DNA ligase